MTYANLVTRLESGAQKAIGLKKFDEEGVGKQVRQAARLLSFYPRPATDTHFISRATILCDYSVARFISCATRAVKKRSITKIQSRPKRFVMQYVQLDVGRGLTFHETHIKRIHIVKNLPLHFVHFRQRQVYKARGEQM